MAHTIADLMGRVEVSFGNGGLRAPADQLSDAVVYAFVRAFLEHLRRSGHTRHARNVLVAGDLRPTTGRMMRAVAAAIADFGSFPLSGGRIPAPALAHYAMREQIPGILVTGSHLPASHNGLKFFRPDGEAGRSDESAIRQENVNLPSERFDAEVQMQGGIPLGQVDYSIGYAFDERLLTFFPDQNLKGWRIGVLEQSTTAREHLARLLELMGATVVRLGRSEKFLALDTESMPQGLEQAAPKWVDKNHLDALVSSDADGDRPMMTDHAGRWLRGDTIGMLAARYLGADTVVTPHTSTSAVETSRWFRSVHRTRVASPDLIHGLAEAAAAGPDRTIIGFAAHGGLITSRPLHRGRHALPALPSRDGLLPILAVLHQAAERRCALHELVDEMPARFTDSIRLDGFGAELVSDAIHDFKNRGDAARTQLSAALNLDSTIRRITTEDGIRGKTENGDVIHLRPSGNTRSLRVYVEAGSREAARALRDHVAAAIRENWDGGAG